MTVVQTPTPTIRVITKFAFFNRLYQYEVVAIEASTDADTVHFLKAFGYASCVDLNSDLAIDAANKFLTLLLVADQARVDALLADGTEDEKY